MKLLPAPVWLSHPVADLEMISTLLQVETTDFAALNAQRETRRVLAATRMEVQQWLAAIRRRSATDGAILAMLGEDAPMIFRAAGTTIAELRTAVQTLPLTGPPGAALQARNALLALGRDLYAGPDRTACAFGERVHVADSEIGKLLIVVDGLASSRPAGWRAQLERAHRDVITAQRISSGGKHPRISREQAVEAIRLTYGIAHTLVLAGAFIA